MGCTKNWLTGRRMKSGYQGTELNNSEPSFATVFHVVNTFNLRAINKVEPCPSIRREIFLVFVLDCIEI